MGSLSAAGSLAPVSTSQHSRSVSTQQPRIPSSRKERYENLLRQHMIQPLPNISIRSALLMQTGMSKSKEVFSKTYRRSVGSCARDTHGEPSLSGDEHDVAPGFLGAATGVWVEYVSRFLLRFFLNRSTDAESSLPAGLPSHPQHLPSCLSSQPYTTPSPRRSALTLLAKASSGASPTDSRPTSSRPSAASGGRSCRPSRPLLRATSSISGRSRCTLG